MTEKQPQQNLIEKLMNSLPKDLKELLQDGLVNFEDFQATIMGKQSGDVITVDDVMAAIDLVFQRNEGYQYRPKIENAIKEYTKHRLTVVEMVKQFFPEINGTEKVNRIRDFHKAIQKR